MTPRPSLRLGCLLAADAAALLALRSAPVRASGLLTQPHTWLAEHGTAAAASTLADLAGLLVALWLGIGLAAAVIGRGAGRAGRFAARLARATLPAVLLRIAAGATGVGILAGGAAAAHAAAIRPVGASSAHGGTGSGALPAPQLPTDPPAAPAPANTATATVRVRPGDSLWRIAGRSLGARATPARIAVTWPRWFAANRAVIGPDPDRLVPGQVLHAPGAATPDDRS